MEYDDETDEFRHKFFKHMCPEHQMVDNEFGKKETQDEIFKENRIKNGIKNSFVEEDDEIGTFRTSPTGVTVRVLKPNLLFEYHFIGTGKDRSIEFEFKDKTTGARQNPSLSIQSLGLDTQKIKEKE